MSVKGQNPDPGKGRKGRPWKYCPVPLSTKRHGWLAAPPLGIYVHHDGYSRVCRKELTDGALPCKYCGVIPAVWRGYTPFWTEDFERFFVLLSEVMFPAASALSPCSPIELSRGKKKTDDIVIRACPFSDRFLSREMQQTWPVDLSPTLFKIWDDPELQQWIESNPADVATPAAVDDTPVSPKPKKKKSKAEERATAPYPLPLPPEVPTEPPLLAEVFPNLLKKVANLKPSTNGDGAH